MSDSAYRIALRFSGVLLAAAGCITSAVLVQLSSGSGTLLGADVCAPTATVNCDYVLGSNWAKIGPIPTTILGLAYFWAVGMWYLLIGPPNHPGRRWHVLPLVVVSLSLCGSLWFMYLMAFELPVWCTWCVAAHVVNGLLFAVVWLSRPRRPAPAPDSAAVVAAYPSSARAGIVLGTIVSLLLLIVLGSALNQAYAAAWQLRQEYLKVTNNADYIDWRHRSAPQRSIPLRPDDLAVGSVDAPSTLVAFSDFECSKCAALFKSAPNIVDAFPGKLRIVFKHFPLDTACNPDAPRDFHFHCCAAALAAEAARSLGDAPQGLVYHRLLYENMARLAQRPYTQVATQAGLDAEQFDAALAAGVGRERLEQDIALGRELGVRGTPALFLNGRELTTWKITTEDLAARVDQARTLALWEKLLREKARPPTPATSKDAG